MSTKRTADLLCDIFILHIRNNFHIRKAYAHRHSSLEECHQLVGGSYTLARNSYHTYSCLRRPKYQLHSDMTVNYNIPAAGSNLRSRPVKDGLYPL